MDVVLKCMMIGQKIRGRIGDKMSQDFYVI